MIFLNNSSASEDSAGEAEPALALDQSMVFLEHSELQAADPEQGSNAWRLYFGSSYESELGHASPSAPVRGHLRPVSQSETRSYQRWCCGLPFFGHYALTSSFPPQNSLSVSVPGSTTQESSVGVLARESAGSLPPACMPTLQGGYQELGPEEQERLLLDVSVVKNSYRRTNVSADDWT